MSTLERPLSNPEWHNGFSLPQHLYCDADVFASDLDTLAKNQWLLVDHESRIARPGDYFTVEVGTESIIIIRDKSNAIHAHYNVCRHRGSRICLEQQGSVRALSCPYHAWTYELSGELKFARHMAPDFSPQAHRLNSCHVGVFAGLIFINLAPGNAPSFDTFIARFRPMLAPYCLTDSKVAARQVFPTHANWKLVVENFFECYHCKPAHPTYCSVHDEMKMLAFGAGPGSSDGLGASYLETFAAWESMEKEAGRQPDMFSDGPDTPYFQSAARLPIGKGHVTESLDGKPVAPLIVSHGEYDGAQTGCVFNPISVLLANSDHAIGFRFNPRGPLSTDVEVFWLVARDAVEGVDYDPQQIKALWTITLLEDKTITENNQAGVSSIAYRPGPYSAQENKIAEFGAWYQRLFAQCGHE
ncbi:aromatic ring-hydroxylating oxygenase subunit alpha [Trinickia diaoshuihuensis]|uniref:aromatic ring-hydroxylating oxygenase subunit alpha n=1 Tax=Trinickia diaoshuihuensis TaxID=2292265 RepID=UPI0013C2D1FE|nr:aromatic ring-hydroxylating dioxygenase subunit alpha [Trinickia diaoshuihuensis]